MSIELLSKISDNYLLACCVHREMADVCWFSYMPGYAMLHEYQFLSESIMQRKIKRYITSTYHMYLPDKVPKSANVADPLIGGKNRKALKMEDSWKTIKELFRVYQEWEESALREYQRVARELVSSGDISSFNFVGEIIKEVKEELVFVTDKIIELNSMDWDMPQIVAEQDTYIERYEYLMRNLLGKSKQYHHWNSNADPESRTSVIDKYPD